LLLVCSHTRKIRSGWLEVSGCLLTEQLAGWSEKFPKVQVPRVVGRQRPAEELITKAESAQPVVVGSRGRGQLTGLIGLVRPVLLWGSSCPVAVICPCLADVMSTE
jgi:hypothetical protein